MNRLAAMNTQTGQFNAVANGCLFGLHHCHFTFSTNGTDLWQFHFSKRVYARPAQDRNQALLPFVTIAIYLILINKKPANRLAGCKASVDSESSCPMMKGHGSGEKQGYLPTLKTLVGLAA